MTKPDIIAEIKQAIPRLPELRLAAPLDWIIREKEQWALIGPNGAGKTLIADILQKRYALKEGCVTFASDAPVSQWVKSIAFKDIHSITDSRNSYYQQRWHATENDEVATVEEKLKEFSGVGKYQEILELFGVDEMLPKRLIFLSSGELRKFLITRALLTRPRILVLDNPFIGLDAPSRGLLVDMLQQMTRLSDTQVILLLSNPADIPPMITHVFPVCDRQCFPKCTKETFLANAQLQEQLFPSAIRTPELPSDNKRPASEHAVTLRMENVSVKYGSRTILKDLNWEVKNGEKWALSGPNGAGKSTLLSLVYADNPQSYANTFYLFDRKRGSGESIWEIKKRIGYVSPEMHLYYMENVPVKNIVGSGFFDSVGLFRKCTDEQMEVAMQWMDVFGIAHLKERSFLTLSSGEQRLALLARAFVKDPDLLILDEPLHGLDVTKKHLAARIIERFCEQPGKTLIYVTHYPNELPSCVDKKFELIKHA